MIAHVCDICDEKTPYSIPRPSDVPVGWYLVRQGVFDAYSDSGALVCSLRCLRQWVKLKGEEPMKTASTSPSGGTEA
ncbi:MAG TPA: hypothetical protein DCP69_01480 [Candidatus Omnitrophica bacterium]|nr:hypothetical protein [Candidatus Omnitrophota bacterium]